MAARAKIRTSSTRLTTAEPTAVTLRYVAVSRNGFSTMRSSPHSTPIGAQFTVPSAATVVTIDSTIMRSANLLDRRRHERRALVVRRAPHRPAQVVAGAVGARRQAVEAGGVAAQEALD